MRCSCSEIRADEKFYRVSMKRDVGNKKTQTRGNTACSKTNILLDQRNQFEWTLPSLIYHPRPTCFPARVCLLVEPQHFERRIPNITGHLSVYVYMLSYFLIRVIRMENSFAFYSLWNRSYKFLDFTTIYITFLQANNLIGVIYFFFRQFQHVPWLWNREIYGRWTYRSHFGFRVTAVLYNTRISNTSINSRV